MVERVSPVAKCIRIVGLQADDLTEIGDGRVILVQADAGERAAVKRLCIARIEPNCGIEIGHGPLELAKGVACQSTRLVFLQRCPDCVDNAALRRNAVDEQCEGRARDRAARVGKYRRVPQSGEE